MERLRGCATAHSNAKVALISWKIKVLPSDLRKLDNFAISITLSWAFTRKTLFYCVVYKYVYVVDQGSATFSLLRAALAIHIFVEDRRRN